ncbi:leucine-rich repeat-containing protein 40 [Elysia marginata]|uniref:Leucine-rich repeat-containing protein 40 n=1 Tax=Elysia marginata TaxID=1093978 RepID=A0AAV4GAQ3_9GAST|nr:leucine-rich repeat-containing protein 40 [Elysia marginata]
MSRQAQRRPNRGGRGGFFQNQGAEQQPGTVHHSILKQARKSGVLNLSQRGLSAVPESVWTIQEDTPEEARVVSMDNNEDKWWDTVELTKLILASNTLSCLDEKLGNLSALTVLDVHDNQLTSLPKAVGSLENLQKLDVGHNNLSELPPHIGMLANLKTLQAEHNHLTELCEDLCSARQLEVLNVSNNKIASLPRYICLLSHLRSLNVSHNHLGQLPPDIGAMDALRIFDGTHNQLASLPDELGNLRKLEQLHLRHNRLQYLPVLRHCESLKEILAGNNSIAGLTEEHLQHLGAVTCLDLRDNKLQKLPEEITLLTGLERLDLTNNDISNLPLVLGTMTSLKALVLDGNPMRSIRRDIIMRGTNEIKKYLVSRMSDDEREKQCEKVQPSSVGRIGGGDNEVSSHDLYQLKALDYSNKGVSVLPDTVVEAALEAGVKTINLSKNMLTELPNNLSVLAPKLTEINIGINKLTQVHPYIAQFDKLLLLDLRNNQLSDLPAQLASLTVLRELVLSCNRFKHVPAVVYSLAGLEILFANDNQICEVNVEGLLKLQRLATLDLQNNDIAQVPPELGNCHWLKSLLLSGNSFRNPRPAILAKGTPATLEYLKSRIVT